MAGRRVSLETCLTVADSLMAELLRERPSRSARTVTSTAWNGRPAAVVDLREWDVARDAWRLHGGDRGYEGLVVLAGACGALAIAAGARAGIDTVWVHPAGLMSLAWDALPKTSNATGDLQAGGAWRCCDGSYVSLLLPDERDHELLERAFRSRVRQLPDRQRPLPLDAWRASVLLQEWGVACLPARPAADTTPPRHGAPKRRTIGPLLTAEPRSTSSSLTALPAPVDTVTLLSLGHVIAGPFAATLLESLGHSVCHVHHPRRPPVLGRQPLLSVPADITPGAAGRELVLDLLQSCDVVLDNFRPRVMQQLGIADRARSLRVARVSLPAFPGCSSASNWKAYGFQLESLVGVGGISLGGDGYVPRGRGPIVSDYVSAFFGAAAALTAPAGRVVELPQFRLLARSARRLRHANRGR